MVATVGPGLKDGVTHVLRGKLKNKRVMVTVTVAHGGLDRKVVSAASQVHRFTGIAETQTRFCV